MFYQKKHKSLLLDTNTDDNLIQDMDKKLDHLLDTSTYNHIFGSDEIAVHRSQSYSSLVKKKISNSFSTLEGISPKSTDTIPRNQMKVQVRSQSHSAMSLITQSSIPIVQTPDVLELKVSTATTTSTIATVGPFSARFCDFMNDESSDLDKSLVLYVVVLSSSECYLKNAPASGILPLQVVAGLAMAQVGRIVFRAVSHGEPFKLDSPYKENVITLHQGILIDTNSYSGRKVFEILLHVSLNSNDNNDTSHSLKEYLSRGIKNKHPKISHVICEHVMVQFNHSMREAKVEFKYIIAYHLNARFDLILNMNSIQFGVLVMNLLDEWIASSVNNQMLTALGVKAVHSLSCISSVSALVCERCSRADVDSGENNDIDATTNNIMPLQSSNHNGNQEKSLFCMTCELNDGAIQRCKSYLSLQYPNVDINLVDMQKLLRIHKLHQNSLNKTGNELCLGNRNISCEINWLKFVSDQLRHFLETLLDIYHNTISNKSKKVKLDKFPEFIDVLIACALQYLEVEFTMCDISACSKIKEDEIGASLSDDEGVEGEELLRASVHIDLSHVVDLFPHYIQFMANLCCDLHIMNGVDNKSINLAEADSDNHNHRDSVVLGSHICFVVLTSYISFLVTM